MEYSFHNRLKLTVSNHLAEIYTKCHLTNKLFLGNDIPYEIRIIFNFKKKQ